MTTNWRRIWRKFDAELDRRLAGTKCPKCGRTEWDNMTTDWPAQKRLIRKLVEEEKS